MDERPDRGHPGPHNGRIDADPAGPTQRVPRPGPGRPPRPSPSPVPVRAREMAGSPHDRPTVRMPIGFAEPSPRPADEPPAGPDEWREPTTVLEPVTGTPPKREPVRNAVQVVGELLITMGLIVLLFVVYEVYITDVLSAGEQRAVTASLDDEWKKPERGTNLQVVDGRGFAKLYIPSFGPDFVFTVLEGTDDKTLEAGPGHYKDTALPGQPGNFAVAGHRVGKGSPFNDLDLLRSCDRIIAETANGWYVYRVLPVNGTPDADSERCASSLPARTGDYAGLSGRDIVLPTNTGVISPVPGKPNSTTATGQQLPLITLTTCHPPFSARQRMIIHGVLEKEIPKDPAKPDERPAELSGA